MIRVQLKEKFKSKAEATRALMSIVNPGDEQYFEFVGKERVMVEKNYLLDDLNELGLVEVCGSKIGGDE